MKRVSKQSKRPRHSCQKKLFYWYDDFPYLSTRIVAGLYHVIPMPKSADESHLIKLARHQVLCNQLPTCLVLASNRCIVFDLAGETSDSTYPPFGGYPVSGRLRPSPEVEHDPEWGERSQRLARWSTAMCKGGGFLLGDLTKGGRPATREELAALKGKQANGIPRGLFQCSSCGQWKGQCLDKYIKRNVIVVSCLCENTNLCAACLQPLHETKLNANYLDLRDKKVWHVPGFCAFSHKCPTGNA